MRASPLAGVRIPSSPRDAEEPEVGKALTGEELRLFLAAAPKDSKLFFLFLTHTGLRISEALGVTWEHLELGRNPRLLVREQLYEGKRQRLKTRSGRRDIPLSSGMADSLRAHRRDRFQGDRAPVFATASGAELRRSNIVNRILKPAAKAAGLTVERDGEQAPWVSFHTFRHTCASLLFEQGRNVKQVAEWLGHADASFTLSVYVHLLDAGVGDANFLDRVVRLGHDKSGQDHRQVASRPSRTSGSPRSTAAVGRS